MEEIGWRMFLWGNIGEWSSDIISSTWRKTLEVYDHRGKAKWMKKKKKIKIFGWFVVSLSLSSPPPFLFILFLFPSFCFFGRLIVSAHRIYTKYDINDWCLTQTLLRILWVQIIRGSLMKGVCFLFDRLLLLLLLLLLLSLSFFPLFYFIYLFFLYFSLFFPAFQFSCMYHIHTPLLPECLFLKHS